MKSTCLPFVVLLGIVVPVLADTPADWGQWRGPKRDAISPEKGLLDAWSEDGPKLAWQSSGLGKGYASIAIVGDRVYTLGERKGTTYLVAVSADDGKEIWSTEMGSGSPNCTPTVDGALIFALGRGGDLLCARTENGEAIWRKNFGKDFGGRMMSGWGYSESPLVDGDRLICTPGADKAMLACLNKNTGETIWTAAMPEDAGRRGKDGAAYSSPVISHGAGVKQYVQLIGRGVIGVRAEDGKVLWVYNQIANGTANIPTPLIRDDYIFCSTGYGTGAALLKLSKTDDGVKADEQYFLRGDDVQNHHGGMILLGNHVYLGNKHNNGFPICLDLLTGKVAWEPGRGPGSGSAAILYADGHLYFRYENGVMALIEATPTEYKLKGQFKLASINGKSWPHPVIASGKLYVRDQDVLMCYDIRR